MDYDTKWRDYSNFTHGEILKEANPLPKKPKILDLGCGTGTLLEKILRRYPDARVYGIEADNRMLAVAKERLPGAVLVKGNIEKRHFEGDFFDLVVSSSVLHFVNKDQALAQAFYYLKDGGRFVVLDFRNEGYFKLVSLVFNLLYEKQKAMSASSLSGALQKGGFVMKKIKKMRWRYYLLQVQVGMKK